MLTFLAILALAVIFALFIDPWIARHRRK